MRRSDRCDFQANAPLAIAKTEKRAPRDVANAIVEKLDAPDVIEKVEVSGPGFLNVTVARAAIEQAVAALANDPASGVPRTAKPETVVIDYSAPNVAKELHVGHLRSTIIGDSLARVLEAVGHRVVRQNHLGDWGTPFGMLIEHLVDLGVGDPEAPLTISDLDSFYKAARAKFDEDPTFQTRARTRVVALQGGDAVSLALWKKLCAESRRYFQDVYDRLGVTLKDSDVAGESSYGGELREVVETLRGLGLAREDQGALCVFPAGFTGKDGAPLPLIIQKNDGGFGYATTDLAAIRHRLKDIGASRIIYVVGAPQSQHFAMVFETAREAKWLAPPARAEHVAFGSVLGPDKKMFKARSGDTVKLAALLAEAEERALAVVEAKSPNLDAATKRENARAIIRHSARSNMPDLLERPHQGLRLRLKGKHARERRQHWPLHDVRGRAQSLHRSEEPRWWASATTRAPSPSWELAERALAARSSRVRQSGARGRHAPRAASALHVSLWDGHVVQRVLRSVPRAPRAERRRAKVASRSLESSRRASSARGLDLLGIASPDSACNARSGSLAATR